MHSLICSFDHIVTRQNSIILHHQIGNSTSTLRPYIQVLLDGKAVWEGQIKKGCGNTTFDYSTTITINGSESGSKREKKESSVSEDKELSEKPTPFDSSAMESILQGFVNLKIQDRSSNETEKQSEASQAVDLSNEELMAEVERRGLGASFSPNAHPGSKTSYI